MPNEFEFEITDNSKEILEIFKQRVEKALTICGATAEGYAVDIVPRDTSYLANHITNTVKDNIAYIGTNVEYAPYVELGTGKHYPGGRQTPWLYTDTNGQTHITRGQRAQPYLKPAVADHADEYREIIKDVLENG